MANRFLSKSDFKIARTCAAKLYYKKHGFPSSNDTNEYMGMLADGGYMVGLMAQLQYPDGIEITGPTNEVVERTEQLLRENEDIILFEPAISINDQLIRIDILKKRGSVLELIEVKSGAFNSDELEIQTAKGKDYWSNTKEYLEDVAFQTKVLKEKYPASTIHSYLMMPDKSKATNIEGLIGMFSIQREPRTGTGFNKAEVIFTGTADDLELVRKDPILGLVQVDDHIKDMMADITSSAEVFKNSVLRDEQIKVQISYRCKGCEYTAKDESHPSSGFELCWGELATPRPHILDLSQIGNINKKAGNKGCIDILIKEGKTRLSDVPVELVSNPNGTPYYNDRPLYQLTAKEEFLLPEFWNEVDKVEYPLHFIDFETSAMALPYHQNMHPYEKVIFQWSCHTITHPGADPIHTEWLNTTDTYPNIKFARSLMEQLGNSGTFMTWSSYENTQLRDIYRVIKENADSDEELLVWLGKVAKHHKDDDTMLLDMNKLAEKYYFHPLMGGRTSIKVTLPAVLQSYTSKQITKWLQLVDLYQKDVNGKVTDPYKLLPEPTVLYGEKPIPVKDGGGAMIAYQHMLYGLFKNDEEMKQQFISSLKKYCQLDTLAMVIIWEHWMSMR